MKSSRILHLTLKKAPFDVMVTGEKREEFRRNSQWLISRLFDKDGKEVNYDYIKFTNGYGADKPYFICVYKGFAHCYKVAVEREYSNGLKITGGWGNFIIYCGEVVERGNMPHEERGHVISRSVCDFDEYTIK